MGKALKAVGTAIVIIGAAVATAGAALIPAVAGGGISGALGTAVFGVTAGQLMTVGALVSSVGGSLSQPKVSNAGSALGWVGDPNGPMHFAAGRIAVGGDLRHKAAYGPDDRMYFSAVTVVSDAGPIDAFESFTANDIPVTFDASGKAITSHYANVMWRRTQRGQQPETGYLASPSGLKNGATLPNWGPSHKLSAKAGFILTLSENSKHSAYKGQYPKPRTVIRGLRVYDWRRDSTVPGGDGPCRLSDPSTWPYSANPILWSVKWLLGLWEGPTGKGAPQVDHQVGGIGARWENIDVAAFTEAANIADTHGWTCAARPSTDDDKAQVLDAFLQAGGAYYIERAGKASCIHRAAPRVSVATITAADTAGPIELDTSASYLDRKNTGVATYLSEADGWKMTALPEVTSPQWVAEDGGRKRSVPVTYSYVDRAKQASELMCLGIAHTREGISGRIPLKSYMQGIGPGSAFTIKEPEFVLDGLKCLCLETSYDANTGVHTVTFVSETDAKYPYAYGQAPNPPAPPALTPVDPTQVSPPQPGDWTIIPRPPAPGGGQLPVIDLSGIVSNATADAMLINWREVVEGEDPTAQPPFMDEEGELLPGWVDAGVWPPTTRTLSIQGPQPGAQIWIAIRYKRGNNVSPAELAGPITVGDLIAGGLAPDAAQKVVQEIIGRVGDIASGVDAAEELAEVVLETIMNEQQALEAEASQRIEDLAAEAIARGEAFTLAVQQSQQALDNYSASASVTFATIVGMNGGLAATLSESKSYTNGQVSSAMSTVYTKAQTDAGLASTLQDARSYTDAYKSEANLTFSTKAERASGDAAAVLQAKAYTDDFKSEASLTYATQAAMASGLASTLNESKSYTNGQVSSAISTVYTKAQVDAGQATTLQQAKSYADDKASEASLLYSTKTERANGDATTLQSAKSYTDDLRSFSNLTFAAQSSLNGVSATAALALSTAQSADDKLNEARVRLVAAAGGGNPALVELFSGEAGAFVRLAAAQILFGDNTVFDDATDQLRTVTNGVRRVIAWGSSFGTDGTLTEWEGPTSVAYAAMSRSNAFYFRANVAPHFGGSALPGQGFHAQANAAVRIGTRTSAGLVTTATVTITTTGATGPVTYAWSQIGGEETWTITASSGAETAFRVNVSSPGEQKRAQFACLVTDTGSGRAFTIPVGAAAIFNV